MKTSLTTNENCYKSTFARNTAYGHHVHNNQQQYYHQYIDPKLTYDDCRQYMVNNGRQYVVVPSARYSSSPADTHTLAPYLDHRLPDQTQHQPVADNMAATGSYASSETGNVYVDGRQIQRLPDVVSDGGLQQWKNGLLQDFTEHDTGSLSFCSHSFSVLTIGNIASLLTS